MLRPEQCDDLRLYIHRRVLLRLHHHDVPQRALLHTIWDVRRDGLWHFRLFLVAGQIAAMLLFDSVIWLASADAPTAEISAIMAFALPMCSLVFLDEENSSSGWGAILPGTRRYQRKVQHHKKAFVGIRADAARDRRGTNSGKRAKQGTCSRGASPRPRDGEDAHRKHIPQTRHPFAARAHRPD